jgi:hypothetical protein
MTADLAHTSSLHRYRAAGPRSSPGGDTRVCPDAAARRTVESYGGGPRSCHSRVFGCGRNELANQQSATPAPRTGLHEGVARPGLGRSQQQRTSACSAAVGGRWARASWTDRPSSLPASGHATSATPARPTCALLGALSRRKDCEDRQRSLMVLGCELVTAGVTPGMTGFRALLRPVHSWLPAPARMELLA